MRLSTPTLVTLCAATLLLWPAVAVAFKTEKGLSAGDARKLILSMPGAQLKKSAVRVREVTTTDTTAEALAGVRTAFRFREAGDAEKTRAGEPVAWRVAEVRVGDRQWEDVELLWRAWHIAPGSQFVADLESLVTRLAARERELQQKKERDAEASASTSAEGRGKKEKKQKKKDKEKAAQDEKELRGDALVVKNFSALLSASMVEAEVEMGFRFTREGGKSWRLTEARVAGGEWREVGALAAAVDAEKISLAREELAGMRAALEAFRRERGFYVVADNQAVLVDQLSPRYLARVARIDPWHRPYRYRGTPERFLLSSDGADGKEGTADDLNLGSTP